MSLTKYSANVEQHVKEFYDSLDERSRRRYAALEAGRMGHGGVAYIAEILGCDAKTIRQGRADLENPPDVPPGQIRKKGGGERKLASKCQSWRTTSLRFSAITRPVIRCAKK